MVHEPRLVTLHVSPTGIHFLHEVVKQHEEAFSRWVAEGSNEPFDLRIECTNVAAIDALMMPYLFTGDVALCVDDTGPRS